VAASLGRADPRHQAFHDIFPLHPSLTEVEPAPPVAIRDVLTGQTMGAVEATLQRTDGSTAHLVVSAQPLTVPADDFRGALVLMVDVTARREAEAAALRSEQALREGQRLEGVGRLAGGIAHEFNNVLTAINGYAELALTLRDPETTYNCLGEIQVGGERLAILTRQLLSYSRKQVMMPRRVDLNSVIEEMDQILGKMVVDTVVLSLDLCAEPVTVKVDASQIQQVIVNLVINACDAMPDGGRLSVATRRQVLDALQPGPAALPDGRWVVLTIADDGVGMIDEVRAHLFEPFFTTKAVGAGTGLGLSVVYGIVRQSGGYVTLMTAPGQGACFEIWLPEAEQPTVQAQEPPCVLLVEDEPMLRSFAASVLQSMGCAVHCALDGQNALDMLELLGRSPDLVVTDIAMPGMGGLELTRLVRKAHPQARFLFMSGLEGAAAVRDEQGGAHGLLVKPFTADFLRRRVNEALGAR
jgi:two-component system cell cycle sensor histidine kinase/response regulator CckA